uniref:Putative Anti-sigma-factor antagonist n=1 Tax=Magnetococcus massalia (strain MO-1) TaxID=451514 RepID=A0A1S7LKV1_MAGMO|nr:putative Anti-sigma-factor antagonist [Candidatus Magnetococcus massalia]
MFQLQSEGSGGELSLSGDLTIQHAADLQTTLVEAAESCDSVTLNISKVERVDVAGLQLLCSFHRTLLDNGKSLKVQGKVPESFVTSAQAAGYTECMGAGVSELWKVGG